MVTGVFKITKIKVEGADWEEILKIEKQTKKKHTHKQL